jgi:hypothetical protein
MSIGTAVPQLLRPRIGPPVTVAWVHDHLSGKHLVALQLRARGYSMAQIAYLLHLGSADAAAETLQAAARAIGTREVNSAVRTALNRGVIV